MAVGSFQPQALVGVGVVQNAYHHVLWINLLLLNTIQRGQQNLSETDFVLERINKDIGKKNQMNPNEYCYPDGTSSEVRVAEQNLNKYIQLIQIYN